MVKFGSVLLLVIAVLAIHLAVVRCDTVCYPDTDSSDSSDSSESTSFSRSNRCEDGPARRIHTVYNEFHRPPIYKGSCKPQKCKDPPCFARKVVWKSKCVLVFKKIYGKWKKIGYHIRHYLDHLECSCKQCSDITNQRQCERTTRCPNQRNRNYFCFWQPGKCDCCFPKSCPRGQIFDRKSCSCVCPRGSQLKKGRCIGDCSDISLRYCKTVFCEDNPFFYCFIKNRKCQCPSCDAQKSASQCPRTKCVEKRNSPNCVYDRYKRKCRCPECSDNKSKNQCVNSFLCGYSSRCKFNDYSKKCFCPH